MADVVAQSTQPLLGAIKLAWWRERLEELDEGKAPAEPRLQAAATYLLPRGVTGADLSKIERGWAVLFNEAPDLFLAEDRGEELFRIGMRLLEDEHALVIAAGRMVAGVDFARRGYREIEACDVAMGGIRFPKSLRPLTALAALASRDIRRGGPPFEAEATPGRAASLLGHRLFGTVA